VIYTALGLCGECSEYYQALCDYHTALDSNSAKLIKETGDVCWYLVEFLSELDIPVDILVNSEAFESGKPHKICMVYAGNCAEIIKKAIRDNGRINSNSLVSIIANLQLLWASLNFDCSMLGISMEYVLEENNRKLLSRLQRGKLNGSGDNR
jgi:NTP pyrophosphatase (non-canonical NTP hydrolase)